MTVSGHAADRDEFSELNRRLQSDNRGDERIRAWAPKSQVL